MQAPVPALVGETLIGLPARLPLMGGMWRLAEVVLASMLGAPGSTMNS